MKKFFLYFLAIFFPWLVLFIKDNPIGGVVAMVMQVTVIGWIPATIWAFNTINSDNSMPKKRS